MEKYYVKKIVYVKIAIGLFLFFYFNMKYSDFPIFFNILIVGWVVGCSTCIIHVIIHNQFYENAVLERLWKKNCRKELYTYCKEQKRYFKKHTKEKNSSLKDKMKQEKSEFKKELKNLKKRKLKELEENHIVKRNYDII